MPTQFMVASRSPILVSGSPAEPGAVLEDFDAKANQRHIDSGAVIEVTVDPDLVAAIDAEIASEIDDDEDKVVDDDDAAEAATTTRRRRRPTAPTEEN